MSRPLYWTDIRHAPASRFAYWHERQQEARFAALRAAYAAAPLLAGHPRDDVSQGDVRGSLLVGRGYPWG
jgi:hypothetical protein